MRTSMLRFTLLMAAAAALGWPGIGVSAAAEAYRARVRFLPAQEASLYIEFSSGQLRIAGSAEEVATVTPIKASGKNFTSEGRDRVYQSYNFSEADLPVTLPGVDKVRASFDFSRTVYVGKPRARSQAEEGEDWSYLSANCRMQKADAEGVTWTFVYGGSGSPKAAQTFEDSPFIDVPTPDNLKLAVVAEVDRKNVGLAVQVKSGELVFDNILKKAKPVEVEVEVTSKAGAVVHTQKGDLQKFGFG